jgi:hypothetical protein
MNAPSSNPPVPPAEPIIPTLPPLPETTILRYFNPADLTFFMAGATLRLTVAGEYSCLQVSVFRMFPLTHPDHYFSIRDGAARELGVLRSLEELDPAGRDCVLVSLTRRYMAAQVRKIVRARERFGVVEWEVETHRGFCRFTTRDLRDNIRRLPNQHYVIPDVEGNRYDIPNLAALDIQSQAWLFRYL